MKKLVSLVLSMVLATSFSVAVSAESSAENIVSKNAVYTSTVMPRRAYEFSERTIGARSSWTSSKYYCVSGQYFGGGLEDPISMTGKIQFSTTTDGPWKTLSTKTIKGVGMVYNVTEKGYYRFVLTNNTSSSVSVQSYVMVD